MINMLKLLISKIFSRPTPIWQEDCEPDIITTKDEYYKSLGPEIYERWLIGMYDRPENLTKDQDEATITKDDVRPTRARRNYWR